MFSTSSTTANFSKKNKIIEKKINLDENLDCFILISSNDENLIELSLNKILDSIINKIGLEETYNDFSDSLEIINTFLKTWMKNNEKMYNLDIIIGILNRNNFIFSNIGTSSCYLVKNNNDIIEITEKNDDKKFFDFISSGELNNDEIVLLGTKRILNYISKSDLLDGKTYEDTESFIKNIKNILASEIIDENIGLTTIKYKTINFHIEKQSILEIIKHYFISLADNTLIKKVIALYMILSERISSKSKNIKNIMYFSGGIISFIFLYIIINSLVGLSNNSTEKETSKQELIQAKNYIRIASENITNPDIFELNINNAKGIIDIIKNKKIFLNDINIINNNISIIKKQFNKVESFNVNQNDILYKGELKSSIKILKNNGKYYIILNNGIIGPIIPGKTPKKKIFTKLEKNETFIDATIIGTNLYILTSSSNIVLYSKIGQFNFVDVQGQKKWEKSKSIDSFNNNIYLVGKETNQIYKHRKTLNTFQAGTPYFTNNDSKEIGEIASIGIDGGIYILQNDLSIIKLFKSPKYSLESIIINKLPKNYKKSNSRIEIKTNSNLNYFYLLMDNKIWVFKPNTKRFQDTKSLTYIGQIEGINEKIIDFFISYDGEITILTKNNISKLQFEITKDKLLLK